MTQHLNDTFPNGWIGRGSTINWPPRSPDLTPLDFCLWGLMKIAAGACCLPFTPFLCRGNGRVELYLYPPSGPYRACNGITLPLLITKTNRIVRFSAMIAAYFQKREKIMKYCEKTEEFNGKSTRHSPPYGNQGDKNVSNSFLHIEMQLADSFIIAFRETAKSDYSFRHSNPSSWKNSVPTVRDIH